MNKRIHLFWAGLIFLSSCLYAQADERQTTVPPLEAQHSIFVNPLFKLPFISLLGYSYEHPLTDKWTLNISPSIGAVPLYLLIANLSTSDNSNIRISADGLVANISVTGRYYYNRRKRMQKGKSLSLNTGNFIGATASYSHSFPFTNTAVDGAAFWGLRSNLGGRFSFALELGINYSAFFLGDAIGPSTTALPHIVIQFAYTLNSIKNNKSIQSK